MLSQIGRWLLTWTWCGWFAKFRNYNAITLYGHFGKPGSSEARLHPAMIAWTMALVQSEDAPHTRHPSRFSIIWIENIWNNWILILLEWAVVAQWPGDPPWPPPGCRAVTGITTWRSEEEKQKGSFVLYLALCWVAGHSWVACSMFSYLNIYTIQFHFTNLSFNAIWLLYHCLGNGKGIIFFFLRINIIFIPEFYKSEQMKGKMVGCVMRWTRTRPPLPRLTSWPWLGTFRPDPPHILILLIFSPPDNIFEKSLRTQLSLVSGKRTEDLWNLKQWIINTLQTIKIPVRL